jgi:Zn-dependent protease
MNQLPPIPPSASFACCRQCFAVLPALALSCPSCHTLVHAERLKTLAAAAQQAQTRGDVSAQLVAWREALELLPPGSGQHGEISRQVESLSRGLDAGLTQPSAPPPPPQGGEKKKWGGAASGIALVLWKFKTIGLFLLTKGKLLLFGLSKGTTFFSMLAAIGVYWTLFGWTFAVGFVLSIYIHEMGHVAAMRRYGLAATPPMFIPGFGALIRMKQHPATPQEEARIGLAGPIWGFAAAAACFLIYITTDSAYWAALAHVGAMINLFNLFPVWQLDGGHAFKALNRTERWIAAAVAGGMFYVTGEGLLVLIAILAVVQALQTPQTEEGDRNVLVQFAGLVVALGLLMTMPVPGAPGVPR